MTYRSKAAKRHDGQRRTLEGYRSLLAYYEEHMPHEEKAITTLKNHIKHHRLTN